MAIQTNTVFLSGPPLVGPLDLFGFKLAAPVANEVLFRYVADRRLELAEDFVGSVSTSDIATTGITTYIIQRNSSNIGTITYGIGAVIGSFADDTEFGDHIVLTGETVSIVAPAVPDATHARISWTLQATFT